MANPREQKPYVPYQATVAQHVVDFHCAYLENLLSFFRTQEVTSRKSMDAFRARKLMSEALWKACSSPEPDSKYDLRYYSQDAHEMAEDLRRPLEARDGVQHEHVVPLKVIERMLFAARPDAANIGRLARSCPVCIVTRSEHRRLPNDPWGDEDPAKDPWRRYRSAKRAPIRVWDRCANAWLCLCAKASAGGRCGLACRVP